MVFKNILFLCVANAVRSQMAEGWARELAHGRVKVSSAGISPSQVDPLAIETMRRAGVDISGQRSRAVDQALLNWADHIITLSDTLKSMSPWFPPSATHHHWSIPNPDALVNESRSREEAYANVCEDLRRRIEDFLKSLKIIEGPGSSPLSAPE